MCHPFAHTFPKSIMMIILFSCIIFLSWIPECEAEANPCADSTWHYYNETGCCYKTTPNVSTWFDGSSMCANLHPGAQLASLHSEKESKWVAKSYKNGIDGIHAWTGLSQTKTANNWTYTDGSKPWSWFHAPFPLVHNHTSCVEIVDNWLVELVQNSGKTQPVFCYTLLNSLCKYCPVPPPVRSPRAVEVATSRPTTLPSRAVRLEKVHPKNELKRCVEKAPAVTFSPTTTTLQAVLSSKEEVELTTVVPPTTTKNLKTDYKSLAGREFDFPKITSTSKTMSPPSTTRKSQLEVNAYLTSKTPLPTTTVAFENKLIKKLKGCDEEKEELKNR